MRDGSSGVMKILLTGNKGFIGSALEKALIGQGHTVIGYDRGDLLPYRKVDIVYHLAANANAYESVLNPSLARENIAVTEKILHWMKRTGTNKLVFTSSREVFSQKNPYGVSKAVCEGLIQLASEIDGIDALVLRLSNVYGLGDKPPRFFPLVSQQARDNKEITIYGSKMLNFITLSDCIEYLLEARPEKPYEIKVMASEKSFFLDEVAQMIIDKLNSTSKITYTQNRAGETEKYLPDKIDLVCHTPINKGVENYVRCIQSM